MYTFDTGRMNKVLTHNVEMRVCYWLHILTILAVNVAVPRQILKEEI